MDKRIRRISIGVICLIILVLPLYISMAASISLQDNYLPIINKQPTLTPTATPIPTATLRPNLQDGYYSGNAGYTGNLWFTISNGRTIASDAGFLLQAVYLCPWSAYSFSGSTTITNGSFGFYVYDFGYLASFTCHSISNTQATCNTYYNTRNGYCDFSSGVASKR